MKRSKAHNVYLSRQTLDIMIALKTCAGSLEHFANARILYLGNLQIDGRASEGLADTGSKLWMKVRVTAPTPA